MQGLTFSLNKNWKKNPKVLSDQVVFLLEEVIYVCKRLEQVGCLETPGGLEQPLLQLQFSAGRGVGTEFSLQGLCC